MKNLQGILQEQTYVLNKISKLGGLSDEQTIQAHERLQENIAQSRQVQQRLQENITNSKEKKPEYAKIAVVVAGVTFVTYRLYKWYKKRQKEKELQQQMQMQQVSGQTPQEIVGN